MRKVLVTLLLTFLFYLVQVCIMPYLTISSITGSILLAAIAVIAITYSPFFAYLSGALSGILMETMLSAFNYFNLILYPVLSLLGAYAFADKTERRLERERSMGKEGKNKPPYLRIPLCAGMMALIRELVSRTYIYLNGVPVNFDHVLRALVAVGYTMALAAIIMLPLRRVLGIRLKKSA